MTLGDLFKYVNQLNEINSKIGVEKRYGIDIRAKKSYESLDCFTPTYTDINSFIKAIEEESFYTDVDTAILDLFETTYNIEDLEYETTFTGSSYGGDKVSQKVYIYISLA